MDAIKEMLTGPKTAGLTYSDYNLSYVHAPGARRFKGTLSLLF